MRDAADGRVILATFAGRRDRMELLTCYAEAALARGDIDEWHVWDFTRNEPDAAWLREKFPCVRLTPGDSVEYFTAPGRLAFSGAVRRYAFSVSASNDVHLGLRRVVGVGDSFEIVIGGWWNQACAIRRFPDADLVANLELRGAHDTPVMSCATPHVLPEFDMTEIVIEIGAGFLRVFVAGAQVISYLCPIAPGEFEILYRSGYDCNAEWRFADMPARGVFRYQSSMPEKLRNNADISRFIAFYQHYARNSLVYGNDVFLKCDDDIVFVALDRLRDFIDFRRRNKQFLMVSVNVVNNGVCAYFQQLDGVIPKAVAELELPFHGAGGTLWSSAEKAEAVHRHFIANPDMFQRQGREVSIWLDRISINFIALLGADFAHVSEILLDDEEYLSYQARWRSRKPNAIYWPFVVSHLSFFPQDPAMRLGEIIAEYRAVAARAGVLA